MFSHPASPDHEIQGQASDLEARAIRKMQRRIDRRLVSCSRFIFFLSGISFLFLACWLFSFFSLLPFAFFVPGCNRQAENESSSGSSVILQPETHARPAGQDLSRKRKEEPEERLLIPPALKCQRQLPVLVSTVKSCSTGTCRRIHLAVAKDLTSS